MQWISLLLVTLGCMVQKMDLTHFYNLYRPADLRKSFDWKMLTTSTGFLLIMVQVCQQSFNKRKNYEFCSWA